MDLHKRRPESAEGNPLCAAQLPQTHISISPSQVSTALRIISITINPAVYRMKAAVRRTSNTVCLHRSSPRPPSVILRRSFYPCLFPSFLLSLFPSFLPSFNNPCSLPFIFRSICFSYLPSLTPFPTSLPSLPSLPPFLHSLPLSLPFPVSLLPLHLSALFLFVFPSLNSSSPLYFFPGVCCPVTLPNTVLLINH